MDKRVLPFDQPHARRINDARAAFLDHLITKSGASLPISTVLDVGTGIGYFAGYISRNYKLRVTALDVRPSNVEEAQRRYPEVTFVVGNVEDADIAQLGQFDLVMAFGLFYHLENPFCAARNLAQMTQKLLVIESMISPDRLPQALLVDEYPGDDQAIRYIAFHLTESGLIKLLYRVGMPYVYLPRSKIDHEDFHGGLFRRRVRTVLVASRIPLDNTLFKLVSEPYYRLDRSYYYRALPRWILSSALMLWRATRPIVRSFCGHYGGIGSIDKARSS